jgi:hypothetical protein
MSRDPIYVTRQWIYEIDGTGAVRAAGLTKRDSTGALCRRSGALRKNGEPDSLPD